MYAGDKPLYWCDPEKRTDCPKDACEHLGLGDCLGTAKPEYAQTDERGQPRLRYLNGMEAYKDIYKEKSSE